MRLRVYGFIGLWVYGFIRLWVYSFRRLEVGWRIKVIFKLNSQYLILFRRLFV